MTNCSDSKVQQQWAIGEHKLPTSTSTAPTTTTETTTPQPIAYDSHLVDVSGGCLTASVGGVVSREECLDQASQAWALVTEQGTIMNELGLCLDTLANGNAATINCSNAQ